MENQEQGAKKKWYKKWWVWVLIVVVVFWIVGSSNSSNNNQVSQTVTTTQQTLQEPVIKVTATQLVSDYEANEVAADNKYKNKIVEVTGTIKTIGKDILDQPYISLSGNSPTIFSDVQCMFDKSDQNQLASLSKDQKITLQGKVSSKLVNVLMNGCSVVK